VELQIKFGDLIARKGRDSGGFSFIVGVSHDTKPTTRPVTWKHAFSGPYEGLGFLISSVEGIL
jgi:hypothetical protein